jgi:hypothetical protein
VCPDGLARGRTVHADAARACRRGPASWACSLLQLMAAPELAAPSWWPQLQAALHPRPRKATGARATSGLAAAAGRLFLLRHIAVMSTVDLPRSCLLTCPQVCNAPARRMRRKLSSLQGWGSTDRVAETEVRHANVACSSKGASCDALVLRAIRPRQHAACRDGNAYGWASGASLTSVPRG